MDVAKGATESPMQALGGVRDAAQNTADFLDWMDEHEIDLPPGGRLTKAAWKKLGITGLPEVRGAKSVTGDVVRVVTQFVICA